MIDGKHFINGFKPVNVFRNGLKLAGWENSTKTGNGTVSFDGTYDDTAQLKIIGKTDLSVDYWKAEGLSTQVQTVQGKNWFDKNRITAGYRLSYLTGAITADANISISDYIPVSGASTCTTSGRGDLSFYTGSFLCWFDSSKAYISGVSASNTNAGITIVAPATAKYARFNLVASYANTTQWELGPTATAYTPFVPNSPSPEYPSAITPFRTAGLYKITTPHGIYEFYLPFDMHGNGTTKDRVVVDFVAMKGWEDGRYGYKVFNETDDIKLLSGNVFYFTVSATGLPATSPYCTHYLGVSKGQSTLLNNEISTVGGVNKALWFKDERFTDASSLKTWFGAELSAGRPVTVAYPLTTPTRTPLTFTKVTSSTAPEFGMEFLTSTPTADYPATLRGVGDSFYGCDYWQAEGLSTQVQTVQGKNLITNGDFSNSFTGWTINNTNMSSEVLWNGKQTAKCAPTSQSSFVYKTFPSLDSTHKYYIAASCYIVNISGTMPFIDTRNYDGTNISMTYADISKLNEWQRVSAISTGKIGGMRCYVGCANASRTATYYMSGVIMIDLTSTFGAGKEPTKESVDTMLSQYQGGWFDSVATITGDIVTYTPNSPSPEYPSPIIPFRTAGLHKITTPHGIYEFYLPYDMHGSGTMKDRVVADFVSMTGWVDGRYGKKVFDGTESISYAYTWNSTNSVFVATIYIAGMNPVVSTHFSHDPSLSSSTASGKINITATNYLRFTIDKSKINNPVDNADAMAKTKLFLAAEAAAIRPVTVIYQLATPIRTPITFTKVTSSTAPEFGMEFLTSTPTAEYPASEKYAISITIRSYQYKSEVPYNPVTWAEWGSSSGIIFDFEGAYFPTTPNKAITMTNTSIKPLTNYGVLFNVVTTRDGMSMRMFGDLRDGNLYYPNVTSTIGNKKVLFTTGNTITVNQVKFGFSSSSPAGDFRFKNIQMFELPIGSQIEDDFANLTPDQLVDKYPFRSKNLYTSESSILLMNSPLFEKNGIKDELIIPSGNITKNVSDVVIFDGNFTTYTNFLSGANYRSYDINCNLLPYLPKKINPIPVNAYKWDGTQLNAISGAATAPDQIRYSGDYNQLIISVSHTDLGVTAAYAPAMAERKAYFWGWKMCNADGTSPYAKSEIPYTPSTFAEFGKGTGVSVVNSELKMVADCTSWITATISAPTIKANTKYLLLYNVSASTLTKGLALSNSGVSSLSGTIPIISGNNKTVKTSNATTTNVIQIHVRNDEPAGNYISLKDFRIIEIVTNSQEEIDANTLTADQLNAKYTFNGLCVKNWKHLTDGLGLTSTLPTASYPGFTPYRLQYLLEEPISTKGTTVNAPTYYPSTIIEATSNLIPSIEATAKVII